MQLEAFILSILRNIFSRFGRGSPAKGSAAVASGRAREVSKTIVRDDKRALLRPGDEQQLVFGGIAEGLIAFVTGEELLKGHNDKIQKLINGIGLPRAEFNRLIYPVIHSFADFAHNVPASKAHHHRSWGGLLEHSLDVACFALNSAVLTSFDYGATPSQRTLRRERWYAAAAIAGLLHDSGKPLNDIKVHDESHSNVWTGSLPIHEWADQTGVERYFISWNPDRGESHKIISSTLFERFIPKTTRDWLLEGGIDIYRAMADAIQGRDPKSLLTGIVIKSDSASVDLNLKTGAGLIAGGDAAVNVPSNFTNAAQYLLETGTWNVNGKGARIWTTTAGVFIAWKTAVPEIVNFFDSHKIRGCPRGSDSLGSVLLDHGIFEAKEDGGLYWDVAPDALVSADAGKRLWLKCVKLSSSSTLYPFDAVPDAVAVCIGTEDNHSRYDPDAGGEPGQMDLDSQGEGAGNGAVSPMFSLDSAPLQKPVGASPVDEISKPGLKNAQSKTVDQVGKPTLGKPDATSAITLASKPAQKPAIAIGISLETNAAPRPAALVIGGSSASGNKAPSEENAAQHKPSKKKKKQSGGPDGQSASRPTAHHPDLTSAAAADDVFGTIAGVDLEISDTPSELVTEAFAQDVDPFSSDASDNAADPFNFKPGAKPPVQAQKSKNGPALSASSQFPKAASEIVAQPKLAKVDDAPPSELRDSKDLSEFEIEDDGLADFDADIMLMVGLTPVPSRSKAVPELTVVADALVHEELPARPVISKQQVSISSSQYLQHGAIPDEFRFELNDTPLPENIPDLPDLNPSLYSPAPENVRIRDTSLQSQEKVTAPQPAPMTLASDSELTAFDAPSFVTGFVQSQGDDAAFDWPVDVELDASDFQKPAELYDAPSLIEPPIEVTSEPVPQPEITLPVREKKDVPVAVATRHLDTSAIVIAPSARSDLDWAAIGFSQATPATGDALKIGRQVHAAPRAKPSSKVPAISEQSIKGHVEPGSSMLDKSSDRDVEPAVQVQSKYSNDEVAVFDAFLDRTNGVREKLSWYLGPEGAPVMINAMRLFLPFCKAGQQGISVSDVEVLSEAGWLWHNFTNTEEPYISYNNRQRGVFLSDPASDCLDYLSGGSLYKRVLEGYETSLSRDEMSSVAAELISVNKHHSVAPAGGARIFKFTNKMILDFVSSRQMTLKEVKRSVFESQEYLFLPNFFYVLVKDEVSSYE